LTVLLVPVQLLLIAFSLRGFAQEWNVEVETAEGEGGRRPPGSDEADAERRAREDVGYEGGAEGVVKEAIFWLANPCLNWPIDAALCARIERLFAEPNGRNDRDL
jgi:hypothetical protein